MSFASLIFQRCISCFYLLFCSVHFGNVVRADDFLLHKADEVEYLEDVLLDRRAPPSDAETYASIERDLPSLPIDFYIRHHNEYLRMNDSCAPYPDLYLLQFHNVYWQRYHNGNLTYILHSAYFDRRPAVTQPQQPLVRLLAMLNEFPTDELPRSYCQLWYEELKTPLIVPVRKYDAIWFREWGVSVDHYIPTLVTCASPPPEYADFVPQTVSLVALECAKATNNLRVVYNTPLQDQGKGGFAICTTGLYFPYVDISARLVEWLELMRELGAKKVVLPDLGLHSNLTRTLQHYVRSGFVESPKLSLVRGEPPLPHFTLMSLRKDYVNHIQNEVIPLTDCFYRNMYKYDYIAVVDVDEVIMPLGEAFTRWADIVQYAEQQLPTKECPNYAAFCFRNVYFPRYEDRPPYNSTAAPHYLYMLQHVARVAEHLDASLATKCFHNTDFVLGVHNHHPLIFKNCCYPITISETVAQLQHYREPDIPETLENPVIDESIWRYKEPLVERSREVLRELGFLMTRAVQVKHGDR